MPYPDGWGVGTRNARVGGTKPGYRDHRDTPPVDVVRRGWSPGSRVKASARLPEAVRLSDINGLGSPLTVAGAAPASHRLPS